MFLEVWVTVTCASCMASAPSVGVSILCAPAKYKRGKDRVSLSTCRLYFDSCSIPIVLTRLLVLNTVMPCRCERAAQLVMSMVKKRKRWKTVILFLFLSPLENNVSPFFPISLDMVLVITWVAESSWLAYGFVAGSFGNHHSKVLLDLPFQVWGNLDSLAPGSGMCCLGQSSCLQLLVLSDRHHCCNAHVS